MRNQKGITLIALIVTIIVLIIIAGISIATLTADNGILRQVDSAKVATIEGNAKEQMTLSCAALRLAIAEAQAKNNAYSAIANAKAIQDTLVKTLNADNNKVLTGTWAEGSAATDGDATFTVKYTGDDYSNATNNTTNAAITFTVTLTQSSIEWTYVSTGITGAQGSNANAITVNDITKK